MNKDLNSAPLQNRPYFNMIKVFSLVIALYLATPWICAKVVAQQKLDNLNEVAEIDQNTTSIKILQSYSVKKPPQRTML